MDLSNCNFDYIETCNNDNIGMKSANLYFPLFFSVFINIHEYANYTNVIGCIFDYGMKGLCLSFILVQMGSFMVWEINMGVCPIFEFDNIMFINCLGYDFYIYGAFEFLCNSIANL